jgi:uncharacterized protein (TIGR01777 family)
MELFVRKTRLPAPKKEAFAWHARPGAFLRLTPPWERVRVVSSTGGIEAGNTVVFKVYQGPLPVTWTALHTDFVEGEWFADRQTSGPFAQWRHTHRFTDAPDGSVLEDRIEYELPLGPVGALAAGRMVREKLVRMFAYRHRVTAQDLALHARYPGFSNRHILVTGAGGLLGGMLVPFLSTGGHRATPLVRRAPGPGEARWNPGTGEIGLNGLPPVDAVAHLAGENIGGGRWTLAKKKRIVESRIAATRRLAETVARMSPRPECLVCASAIGLYGNRGDTLLTEDSAPGEGFIPWLCREWEAASEPARNAGIRVVHLRIGVVLTPAGGALQKLAGPARAGLCVVLGAGSQAFSWVAPDDVLGAALHALARNDVRGPVNVVAPCPVTNRTLAETLRGVAGRGLVAEVPPSLLRAAFGEMAEEVLLASARVAPRALLDTGYEFLYPTLLPALQDNLGVWREEGGGL